MRRSSEERELLGRAAAVLPAGVRNAASSPRCAMLVADAAGARIRDLSGNEYIDYLLGSGPMLLGHAHPRVVEAVTKALQRGSSYLLLNEAAVHLAERIVAAVPCAEQVTLHSSGSEATFFALRLARAFRRRDKILKFEGGFHGMGDVALMSNQWLTPAPGAPQATPVCAGIPRAAAGDVLVAPFNDAEKTVEMIARHAGELAAVIVEPMQRTIPPEPGFLQALREATEHHGVLLVFDEVVTGFRLAYGGAQQYYGVVPDLCALGKSISAGHPLGVVAGRAEILRQAEPSRAAAGDWVALTGTYSGNPVSAAAALASLSVLREPGVYDRLFAVGSRLMSGLREAFDEVQIPVRVSGEPPVFELWFTGSQPIDFRSSQAADQALHRRFTEMLADRGVLKGHEKFFVSLAHGEAEIEQTLAAFREVAGALAGSRSGR